MRPPRQPHSPHPHPHHSPTHYAQRLVRPVVVLLAGVALTLGTPINAAAHDAMISSTPADGATLAASPASVSFTFDEPVENFQPVVSVIGPDGQQYRSGPAEVNGNVVSSAVSSGPAGAWVAAYRVVSSDGHPVTGEVKFTVTGGPSTAAGGTSSAGGATSSAAGASPAPATASTPAATAASGGSGLSTGLSTGIWIGLAVAAALLAAAVFVLLRRPRRPGSGAGAGRGTDSPGGPGSSPPNGPE